MCCFNRPVDHVDDTRIFVGAKDGKQLTVYTASIIGHQIEMVLPVRTRGAKELEFVNFKGYEEFFADCERASTPVERMTKAAGAVTSAPNAQPQGLLKVQQVGDYKVSFAPTWQDLDRLDPRTFKLSDRLGAVVRKHYPAEEFGFVVYRAGRNGKMHPLAYRHAIRPGDKLFVPTRHEHGHVGAPDWDHRIYHQGRAAAIAADVHAEGDTPAEAFFAGAKKQGKPVPPELHLNRPLHRLVRERPTFPNSDLLIPVEASMLGAVVGGAVAVTAGVGAAMLRRRSLDRGRSGPAE